eukprot:TRINITY_DN104532_c0_g1_i1.p1 TRINITY_DN104532_c0_g1~~TRINITY_DN104532_c0_g1_i1.p1  ORF type:complete len:389 (-),score=81.25 TRINITY_DN104532_c0_g1_i1:136-1248(-)
MDAAESQGECTRQLAKTVIAGVLSAIAYKDAAIADPSDEVLLLPDDALQNLPCGRCSDLIRGVPCSQDGMPLHIGCVDRSRSFLQLKESPDGEQNWELVAGQHRFSGIRAWMTGVIDGAAALPRQMGENVEEAVKAVGSMSGSSKAFMEDMVGTYSEIASSSVDSAVSTSKEAWKTAVTYTDLAEAKIDSAVSASKDLKDKAWRTAVKYTDAAESKIDRAVSASKDIKEKVWHTAEVKIDKAVSASKGVKDQVSHKFSTSKETVCQAVTVGTEKLARSVTTGKAVASQAVGTGKEKVQRSLSSGKAVIKTLPEKVGRGKAAVSGAAGLVRSKTSELVGGKVSQRMSSVSESVKGKMQAWKTKSTGSAGGA